MSCILIKSDSGIDEVPETGDAIQTSENRIRLVSLDSQSELVDGWLFGARGKYTVWLKTPHGREVEKHSKIADPITSPDDDVLFQNGVDGAVMRRSGDIARLKIHP